MQQDPFQSMNQQWPQQQNTMPPFGMQQPSFPTQGQAPFAAPQNPFGMQQDPFAAQQPFGGAFPQQPAAPFGMQQVQPSMQQPLPQMPVQPQQWPPPGAQQAMTPEYLQQMQYDAWQWQQAQQQGFSAQPVRKPKKTEGPQTAQAA